MSRQRLPIWDPRRGHRDEPAGRPGRGAHPLPRLRRQGPAGLGSGLDEGGGADGAEEAVGGAQSLPTGRHDSHPRQPLRRTWRLLAGRPRPGGSDRTVHTAQLRGRDAQARAADLRASDAAGDRRRSLRRPAQAARPPVVRPLQAGQDGAAVGVRARGAARSGAPEPDRRRRAAPQAQADADGADGGRGQRDPGRDQGVGAHPRGQWSQPGRSARPDRRGHARHVGPDRGGARHPPLRHRRHHDTGDAADLRDGHLPEGRRYVPAGAPEDRPLESSRRPADVRGRGTSPSARDHGGPVAGGSGVPESGGHTAHDGQRAPPAPQGARRRWDRGRPPAHVPSHGGHGHQRPGVREPGRGTARPHRPQGDHRALHPPQRAREPADRGVARLRAFAPDEGS